jgi:asparagine synthetase B (glutamine-hydrolysing)
VSDFAPYVMSPTEIAAGYVHGHFAQPVNRQGQSVSPRIELERVIERSLERSPCGVAFSGGRDSSLVLALAVHVAQREGLPAPIPITRMFADAPLSEERGWQEMVIRHLQLKDWQRISIGVGEMDVVSPLARDHLTRHGVIWPPMIHADIPLLAQVRGGSLLDGEAGDEVLGVGAHRIAPVADLVRSPRPLRRRRTLDAVGALAPGWFRAARVRRRWSSLPLTWLRPDALDALVLEPLGASEAVRPLSFSRSVQMVPTRRTRVLMSKNRAIMAMRHDVEITSPLADPHVVGALARHGGRLGPGDRAAVLRELASDLLPEVIMRRSTKASFGEAYLSRFTRELATHWTGGGVDPDLVDPDELRRLWLSDHPPVLTWALVQAAWLSTQAESTRPG